MIDFGPDLSFHGLPLSPKQEMEIQHYIHHRQRQGLPPNVQELRRMLHETLDPPVIDDSAKQGEALGPQADAEHAAGLVDSSGDQDVAAEERTTAREAAAMKHPTH
jgi:hypothetical protein